MAALKCWLQEMLATEIGLASSQRRDGVAAAMPRRRKTSPWHCGDDAAWPRRRQDFRDAVNFSDVTKNEIQIET